MCVGGPGPRFYMKKFIDAGGKNLQPAGLRADRLLDIDAASEGRIALTFLFLSMRNDGDAGCRGKMGKV